MTQPDGKTTYKHLTSDEFDHDVWPDTGLVDDDGYELFTFKFDEVPGDAKGVEPGVWEVSWPASPAPAADSAPSPSDPTPGAASDETPGAAAGSDPAAPAASNQPATDPAAPDAPSPAPGSTPISADDGLPDGTEPGGAVGDGTLPADPIGSPSSSPEPTGAPDAGQAPIGGTDLDVTDGAPVAASTDVPADSRPPAGGTQIPDAAPAPGFDGDPGIMAPIGAGQPAPSDGTPTPDAVSVSSDGTGGTTIDGAASGADQAAIPPGDTAATTPPDVPAAPVIEEPHDGQVLEDSLVKVSGTTDTIGSTVLIYADSRPVGQAPVDAKGDWQVEVSLPNADYKLTAVTSDTGRYSGRSDAVNVTVAFDPQAPAEPVPDDPDQAFAKFLRGRLLRDYPLNWDFISELRGVAEIWLDEKGL